jgi:micrococcal nuclease
MLARLRSAILCFPAICSVNNDNQSVVDPILDAPEPLGAAASLDVPLIIDIPLTINDLDTSKISKLAMLKEPEPEPEPVPVIVTHLDLTLKDVVDKKVTFKSDTVVNYKDTVKFVPPITEGFVVKVYDGDTITLAAKLPYDESPIYRFQVRLNGIDTPEMKGKTEDEKKAALYSKNEMIHLVMNKTVELKNVSTEKYGRILADVYVDGLHVNKWMLDNNLAVAYDGGSKKSPESWVEYHHTEQDDSDSSD